MLAIVSAVVFVIFYVFPSADPATLRAGRNASPEQVDAIRHALGLDQPVYVQYYDYMKGIVLHFDFGYSYQLTTPTSAPSSSTASRRRSGWSPGRRSSGSRWGSR